jgi:hypothetical protein
MTGIERIVYIHLLKVVTLRAGIKCVPRSLANWHKISCLGANQLQHEESYEPRSTSTSLSVAAEHDSAG